MTKKTPVQAFAPLAPSTAPGGYRPSQELDRLNEFARMAFELEAALTDRSAQVDAVCAATAGYLPEFRCHAVDLQALADAVAAGNRLRGPYVDPVKKMIRLRQEEYARRPKEAREDRDRTEAFSAAMRTEQFRTFSAALEALRALHRAQRE